MNRLSNEELTAIRERAEKATEGKWYYEIDGDLYSEKTRERVVYPYLTAESIPYIKVSKEDAAFIAHAREDIPKLLAEVERLRTKNYELLEWNRYYFAENKRLKHGGDDE